MQTSVRHTKSAITAVSEVMIAEFSFTFADNKTHLIITKSIPILFKFSIATDIAILFGRLFVKQFALWYRTVVCPVCVSVLSCKVGVL